MKKLVRDLIPALIAENGRRCSFYQAGEEEFLSRLQEKLKEEVEEFIASGKIEELADIVEVLKAFASIYQFSEEEIAQVRLQKMKTNGAFLKRYILEY